MTAIPLLHLSPYFPNTRPEFSQFARPWPRACQILDLSISDRFKSISDICFLFLAQTIVSCLDYVHAREAVREPRAMGIGSYFNQRGDIFANSFLKPSKCDFEQRSQENVWFLLPQATSKSLQKGEPISWHTLLGAPLKP